METPTQSAAGTAPDASVIAVPAAEPSAPVAAAATPGLKAVMASLTSEQRLLVATGKADQVVLTPEQKAAIQPPPAESAPSAPEPAARTAPETQPQNPTPEAGQAGASPEPGEEGEGRGREGKRYRFSSEEDQAVAQIAKSKGLSLVEAARLYAGEVPPAAAPAAVSPAPVADQFVTDIDTKVAAHKARIEAATKERAKAAEDLDSGQMLALTDEITDLKAEAKLLENEKQGHLRNLESQRRSGWEGKVSESRDRAVGKYPALANENGMERLALEAFVNRAINDPQQKARFQNADWPERLAEEFCEANGIKAAGTAPAATPPAVQPTQARAALPRPPPQQVTAPAGAKLLTGADGRSSAPRTLTRDDAIAAIRDDPQARRAIREHLFKKN